MNTNLNSAAPSPRAISGEGWAAIAGAASSAFLFGKKLLGCKSAKPELVSRAEFCAEMLASRERMHADHLALLERLDANHRELLATLDRQVTRINALESGLARVDERTGYGSPKSEGRRPKEGRNPNPQPGGSGCEEAQ
jgi:hypothetical protein